MNYISKIKYLIFLISSFNFILFGAAVPNYSELAGDCFSLLTEKSSFPEEISKIILDYTEDELIEQFTLKGHAGEIHSMITIGNNLLVSGASRGSIKVWDLNSRTCLKTLEGHKGAVWALLELSNNQLASGDSKGAIKIWDLKTGECKKTITEPTGIVFLKLLKNNRFAAGLIDQTIKIYNTRSGKLLQIIKSQEEFLKSPEIMIYSCTGENIIKLKDQKFIKSSFRGPDIQICDVSSGKQIKNLEEHEGGVLVMKQLNDNILISGSHDRTLKVWDLNTGKLLTNLFHNSHGITNFILFAKNLLATGLNDKTLTIYDIFKEEPLKEIRFNSEIKCLHHSEGFIFIGLFNGDVKVFMHTPSVILNGKRPQIRQVKEKSGCIIC